MRSVYIALIVGSVLPAAVYAQPSELSAPARDSTRNEHVAAAAAGAPKSLAEEQSRTRLGLTVSVLPPAQRKALGVEFGVRIEAVDPAADITGKVNRGDVIVAVNDEKFSSLGELDKLVARHKPGSTVALLVRRGDERLYVPVKVLGK